MSIINLTANSPKFTFNDIILMPDYSDSDNRDKNLGKCKLFDFELDIPVISSPMDTVTGIQMMKAMRGNGAIGVHHRYCDESELKLASFFQNGGIAISPSLGIDFITKIHSMYPKTFFVFDVAHGDTKKNLDFCKDLKLNGVHNITTGNIVSKYAVDSYLNIGVTVFKVGVGSGSACTTRVVTGFGYPQASAIYDLNKEFGRGITIISDGGCSTTGDIIKAFALGADFVMSGRLFAGTEESISHTTYRGMASASALSERKDNYFAEGEEINIKPNGSVANVLMDIKNAIEQACYYSGSGHYKELMDVDMYLITNNSHLEGMVRK